MPTFLERIRSGSIDHALWAAMANENVRDLPSPYTVTLADLEEQFNVTAAQTDQMQLVLNQYQPGGPLPAHTVAGVLRLAKDGVPGYTTDQEILDRLGVIP